MKKQPSFNFLHHVDTERKIVYVYVRSWLGAMGANALGKQLWPDHEIKPATQQLVEDLNGN